MPQSINEAQRRGQWRTGMWSQVCQILIIILECTFSITFHFIYSVLQVVVLVFKSVMLHVLMAMMFWILKNAIQRQDRRVKKSVRS